MTSASSERIARVLEAALAAVRNTGRPSIANQCDITVGEHAEEPVPSRPLVERVVADQWCLDSEVGKQPSGMSSILGRDQLSSREGYQASRAVHARLLKRYPSTRQKTFYGILVVLYSKAGGTALQQ